MDEARLQREIGQLLRCSCGCCRRKARAREEEMGKGMDRERRREEIAGTGYPLYFQNKLKEPVG